MQHVARVALDEPAVRPDEPAHHQRRIGLVAQEAQARQVRLGDEVAVADGLGIVGAGDHIGGDVERHGRCAEGDAVLQGVGEMREVHRLAARDAGIVGILHPNTGHVVGAQPVENLVLRACEAHGRAVCIAHSFAPPRSLGLSRKTPL